MTSGSTIRDGVGSVRSNTEMLDIGRGGQLDTDLTAIWLLNSAFLVFFMQVRALQYVTYRLEWACVHSLFWNPELQSCQEVLHHTVTVLWKADTIPFAVWHTSHTRTNTFQSISPCDLKSQGLELHLVCAAKWLLTMNVLAVWLCLAGGRQRATEKHKEHSPEECDEHLPGCHHVVGCR